MINDCDINKIEVCLGNIKTEAFFTSHNLAMLAHRSLTVSSNAHGDHVGGGGGGGVQTTPEPIRMCKDIFAIQ